MIIISQFIIIKPAEKINVYYWKNRLTYCEGRAIIDIPLKGFIFLCTFLHRKIGGTFKGLIGRGCFCRLPDMAESILLMNTESGEARTLRGRQEKFRYAGGADMRVKDYFGLHRVQTA